MEFSFMYEVTKHSFPFDSGVLTISKPVRAVTVDSYEHVCDAEAIK
jgi:hypothetical protein